MGGPLKGEASTGGRHAVIFSERRAFFGTGTAQPIRMGICFAPGSRLLTIDIGHTLRPQLMSCFIHFSGFKHFSAN
jgi:hypothetical protein